MKRAELRDIHKVFETPSGSGKEAKNIQALGGVNITFLPREIHALLGENGAGKSTLVHILSGMYRPTSGCINIGGQEFKFTSPSQALSAGIAMVHQRPLLSEELTVLENILLGVPSFFLSRKKNIQLYRELARKWNIHLEPETPVRTLSPADRLRTALLAAVYRNPDFLILDEPSGVFSQDERDDFFTTLRSATSRDLGIILITHRIEEAVRWADKISVLRKGELVYSSPIQETGSDSRITEEKITRLLSPNYPANASIMDKNKTETTRVGFQAEKITARPHNRQAIIEACFSAKPGKITGIIGLPGSGLDVLEDILSGMILADEGTFLIGDKHISAKKLSPSLIRNQGIAIVPSDRSFRGSHPALTLKDILAPAQKLPTILDKNTLDSYAQDLLTTEEIPALPNRLAGSLSGGQLQRTILARELSRNPKILFLFRPEWGLDIASTARLKERLRTAAANKMAILILTDNREAIDNGDFFDTVNTLSEGRLL